MYLNKEEKEYEGWEKSSWYWNDLERRRKELINNIREEAGTSSLKYSFFEAYGRSVSQLMIIVSMGSVPYAQLISVPISLISLSFSAVKAYCSMRQGDEAETDPDIKFLILNIFPLMLDSIICSLVLCTYVVGFMGRGQSLMHFLHGSL